MTSGHHLLGRGKVLKLVTECLERTGHDEQGDVPFVLLLGPRGSGKSSLLRSLKEGQDLSTVPRVFVDVGRVELEPRRLISQLKFEFQRSWKGYGRLRFPRLELCGFVLGQDQINRDDRREALRQITLRMREDGALHRSRDSIDRILEQLERATSLPPGLIRSLASIVMPGVGGAWLRWHVREQWKPMSNTGDGSDALDSLVDLYINNGNDGDGQDEVDEALCLAFLTDLADAVHHGVRAALSRPQGCLLLLDNVDSQQSTRFLDLLSRVRNGRTAKGAVCDPLVVVASSRTAQTIQLGGEVKVHVPGGTVGVVPSDTAQCANWDQRQPGPPHRQDRQVEDWWYPVGLRDLTHREITSLVLAAGLDHVPHLDTVLHRLTAGHPWTTQLLIRTLQKQPDAQDTTKLPDLRRLLDLAEANRDGASVSTGDQAQRFWLDGLDPSIGEALVTCSARPLLARELSRSTNGATRHDLLTVVRSNLLQEAWWKPDSEAEPARLHPVLHHLLTRSLARRPDDHPDSWSRVHERQRQQLRATDDQDLRLTLYHTLALGDVASVARQLEVRLDEVPPEAWLEDLEATRRAPLRLDDQFADLGPRDQTGHLADGVGPSQQCELIGQLVAALWIAADPLGDPHDKLVDTIHNRLSSLALRRTGLGSDVLHRAADIYRATHQLLDPDRRRKDPTPR